MRDTLGTARCRRKPNVGPGHKEIICNVKKSESGEIQPSDTSPPGYVQCFTVERDPFMMKPKDWQARYILDPTTFEPLRG